LDFGQLVYSNYWETCVLKNLTHAFEAESISGLLKKSLLNDLVFIK
jgi:hypothetical protein